MLFFYKINPVNQKNPNLFTQEKINRLFILMRNKIQVYIC